MSLALQTLEVHHNKLMDAIKQNRAQIDGQFRTLLVRITDLSKTALDTAEPLPRIHILLALKRLLSENETSTELVRQNEERLIQIYLSLLNMHRQPQRIFTSQGYNFTPSLYAGCERRPTLPSSSAPVEQPGIEEKTDTCTDKESS
jgi:hypothetical protein